MKKEIETCYCQSGLVQSECCGPFLQGSKFPGTAEQLMRSRYSAYVTQSISYLKKTLWPEQQSQFDRHEVENWANQAKWLGLEILRVEKGSLFDTSGIVEFKAHYKISGRHEIHHEVSRFQRGSDGKWYYVQNVTGQ